MTYAQIKRFTLELINRYSIAGEPVSPAYNQQADRIQRIPNLINAALKQISLTLDPFGQALPDELPQTPPDTYELFAPEGWIQTACYYAAAYLVADENEFLYAALMNEFETFLNRLAGGRIRAEYTEVRPAYDFGGMEWLS
ncbi:MAG: hypothetical protein IJR54_07770 [Oscillibacter sp.]|nr:hypothetical protein [Oscillibacter sp.]